MSSTANDDNNNNNKIDIAKAKKYCLVKDVKSWPYKIRLSPVDMKPIQRFFDVEPFFARDWEIYHIEDDYGRDQFLVTLTQVQAFFSSVKRETGVNISDRKGKGLTFAFRNCDMSQLSCVGITTSHEAYNTLADAVTQGKVGTELDQEQLKARKLHKKEKAKVARQEKFERYVDDLRNASAWLKSDSNMFFVCVDVESYERNHDIITEVGISVLDPSAAAKQDIDSMLGDVRTTHYRIYEHRNYRNGSFVLDNSDSFRFGKSEFVPLKDLPKRVALFFRPYPEKSIVLVGHDVKMDMEYLRKIGYDVTNLKNLKVLDTVNLWRGMSGESNAIGLGKLCREVGIDCWDLHNAGNDAHYTMLAFLKLIDKLDSDETVGEEEIGQQHDSTTQAIAQLSLEEQDNSWNTPSKAKEKEHIAGEDGEEEENH